VHVHADMSIYTFIFNMHLHEMNNFTPYFTYIFTLIAGDQEEALGNSLPQCCVYHAEWLPSPGCGA